MALTPAEQREFDRQLARHTADIIREGEADLVPPDHIAGFNKTDIWADNAASPLKFYSGTMARGNYMDFQRLQKANPFLGPEARAVVDRLSGELMDEYANNKSERTIKVNALERMFNIGVPAHAQETPVARAACDMYNEMEAVNNAFESKANLTRQALENLNGIVKDPFEDWQIQGMMDNWGVDMNDPALVAAKEELIDPEINVFTARTSPMVDFENFTRKMRAGNPAAITQNELDYAVATFDTNMNGFYGRGMQDLKPDNPLYVARFNNIFVNGESVASLCASRTDTMSDVAKVNYMKCFVTAEAVAREKHIDFIVPKQNEMGLRTVPLVTRTDETPPQKGFFARLAERVMRFFGVEPAPTKQEAYEQMLASETPEAKAERENSMLEKAYSPGQARANAPERDAEAIDISDLQREHAPAAKAQAQPAVQKAAPAKEAWKPAAPSPRR